MTDALYLYVITLREGKPQFFFFRFVDPEQNSIISVMEASTLKAVCYNADCSH